LNKLKRHLSKSIFIIYGKRKPKPNKISLPAQT
jgi:hypothetical protein